MAFKMAPRSPLMKSLKGGQKNLPEGLKKAIEAAPGKMMDSPAKMGKGEKYDVKMASDQNLTAGARKNYAENAEAAQKSSPAKLAAKNKDTAAKAAAAKAARRKANGDKTPMPPTGDSPAKNMNKGYGSPAKKKKTTADPAMSDPEIVKRNAQLKDHLRRSKGPDSDMGPIGKEKQRRTLKPILKGTSAEKSVSLPPVKITDSPAKLKDSVTGKKIKGYAKSNIKVDRVRDRQERKETRAAKMETAKSDGKVTRLEKKGIRNSQANLKNEQVADRNNKFQDQKVKDKKFKEGERLRQTARKLNNAVAVGLDKNQAQKKMDKADAKADKRVGRAAKRAERRKF